MTMATTTMDTAAATAESRPGRSLEELVDRVFEARRLRKHGDLDGALALLAGADFTDATEQEARWTYTEWLGIARRRFAGREGAAVYSPGTGRAAVLAPHPGGALEVLAVMGMRWEPGKLVSRRSLRGLRPLAQGGSR
ncbi:MAG: hypothetical protein OXI32_09070 [bacterium]|nr:hypothetical protein [Chloroflexota bacterium]MDE0614550.1 hypothetical protein [bacterium]